MMPNPNIIITGVHMTLTDALKQLVTDKSEKLFRHQERILRFRIELIKEAKKNAKELFTAKGHIQIHGPEMVVSETTDDIYKSIDLTINRLDRMLEERAKEARTKRKHPHDIDIPSDIPKIHDN